MAKIKGKQNYTIEGDGSYIVDSIEKIEEVHIHKYGNSADKHEESDEKELEPFFDIGIPKTPGLNFIFGYLLLLSFIGINYLKWKYSLSFQIYITIIITFGIGLYILYILTKTKFVNLVYIKENEVIRGQASYPYDIIRVEDIQIDDNGIIKLPFKDDSRTVTFNMKDDAAGLLRHKIREYHQFYNKENK